MSFEKYSSEFKKQALEIGYSEVRINELLEYAGKLFNNNVPVIYDVLHLSFLLGVDEAFLYKISNDQSVFYRKFYIAKKNGTQRKITEPLPALKNIQRWILDNILNDIRVNKHTKAFQKGLSIKNNARFHQGQNLVICMDIENYFGTISEYSVYSFFVNLGYTVQVSEVLAKLCCLDKSLPQGATTSPALSNIITINLDRDLANFATSLSTEGSNIRYTRYADDITFSGMELDSAVVIRNVRQILKKHGFSVNVKKTRVLGQNAKQMVTGVVVNKKMQVSSSKRRSIRQKMFYIDKYGLQSHLENINCTTQTEKYIRELLGEVNFVLHINPKDVEFVQYKRQLIEQLKMV